MAFRLECSILEVPRGWSYDHFHFKFADFENKSGKRALWIGACSTPQWVTEALKPKMPFSKRGTDSFQRGTRLDGASRPQNVVHLPLSQRDEYSWTVLILQHTKCGQHRRALEIYEEMQKVGVEPSPRTFISLLKACSSLQDLESAKRIHVDVVRSGCESDLFVGTMLVDVYAKCRSLVDAKHAFEKMCRRDVVSWNAMILGYAQMHKGKEALQLYTRMQQEGVVPNDRTYVSALKACSTMAEWGEKKDGDGAAFKRKCLDTVRAVHTDIVKGSFESSVFVGTMLVDAYAKCGSLEDARRVFEDMPERTVVSWNAMILGCAQMDKGEDALQLYMRMQREGVVPDDRTYVSALKACSALVALDDRNGGDGISMKERCLETVRDIHANVRKGKFETNLFVGNMLVDVYAKCGSLEDARSVFEEMPQRDVVSWNAMILGYSQRDQGEEGLELYRRMEQEGVVPNDRTYVSALKACSTLAEQKEMNERDGHVRKCCLETVGNIHADCLKQKFESDVFVATMLVDSYAKCGSLEDARRVFENMPRRDVVSWNTMILGFVQMDMGEDALKLYSRMQTEGVLPDERTYVSVLNACSSVAGLEKGKEIHGQIVKRGLQTVDSFVMDSLIDMYAKCGSMADARQVFDAVARKGIVAWNALIAGYAHQGESEVVFDLFQRMKQEGKQPDGITLLGVLTVCSQVGLVDRGHTYFETMGRDYGITPSIKHFTCLIDLLGRAGHLDKAMEMVQTMPFQPHSTVWMCMLGACRKWGAVELGRQAFECAVGLNKDDAAAYVLMSNIYSAANMWQEAKGIQAMRVKLRAWKQPGWSQWTDMTGVAHLFMVGDQGHPESRDLCAELEGLLVRMTEEGYVPHLASVLRDTPDEKENGFCGHSAELALAYALLKPSGGA